VNNANSEVGKGLIAFANLLLILIFLQPFINNKIDFNDVFMGISFGILFYILGWILNFKENQNGS
jgi:uncharacterized membrane protein (DUF485 family)